MVGRVGVSGSVRGCQGVSWSVSGSVRGVRECQGVLGGVRECKGVSGSVKESRSGREGKGESKCQGESGSVKNRTNYHTVPCVSQSSRRDPELVEKRTSPFRQKIRIKKNNDDNTRNSILRSFPNHKHVLESR